MAMSKYQPALLGGLFIGVMSSLPIISAANVCCCLWVVAGGVLVTYLLQQRTPEPLETADAVIGSLIAGLIGAAIVAVIQAVMVSYTGFLWQDSFRSQVESNPDIPPELRDFMINLFTGRNILVLTLVFTVPMFAVFSMLGGLLGLAFFRKKIPPTAPQG